MIQRISSTCRTRELKQRGRPKSRRIGKRDGLIRGVGIDN